MQNSHHQGVSLFSRGAWLIIAGVLLLGHAPALAKPSLLIVKRGGVYYISNREQPRSNQSVRHNASLEWLPYNPQARAGFPGVKRSTSETDQPHNLRPEVIKAANRIGFRGNINPTSVKGLPDLSQLRLKKAHAVEVGNVSDPQGNMGTAPRYLGWLWTKTGYRAPLALAAYNPGFRRPDLQQNLPAVQEIQVLVRDACKHFLAYTPTVQPGADFLADSNSLNYCFPVAPPYSFRDTWGDWRSGGRFHHAVDIMASDGTPVYAITSGVIQTLVTWPGAGISLFLRGQDGRAYGYMHLQGYAPGIVEGKTVHRGELIAYVGHTGIKQDAAHLHLQVYADGSLDRDKLVNPYGLLVQLSQGKGVADWSSPTMARRQIPAAKVVDFGPVTLSGSVPRRYQAGQPKIIDAPIWLTNTY